MSRLILIIHLLFLSIYAQEKKETETVEDESLDMFYYKNEYKELRDKKKRVEQDLADLKNKSSKEIEDLQFENQSLRKRIIDLEKTYAELKERSMLMHNDMENRISNLERDNKKLQEQKDLLEKKLVESKKVDDFNEKEKSSLQKTIDRIEKEKQILQERLNNVTAEVERLRDMIKSYEEKLELANSKIARLEAEKVAESRYSSKIKDPEALVETLRVQNKDLLIQRDALLTEIDQLKSPKVDYAKKLEEETAKLKAEYESRIESLEIENKSLRAEIDRIIETRKQLEDSLRDEIEKGKIELANNKRGVIIRIPHTITFDTASTKLKPEGKKVLVRIMNELTKYKIKKVQIEGNTDDRPVFMKEYKDNWELSLGRSLSVLRYLAKKGKLHPKYMTVAGNGQYNPLKMNTSENNRAVNRRVEILVITSSTKKL
ncbi:MAG: OmpA family protein [Leptospiraceae bacterium]|nr:OmpA family protein [Leptospiraceae bacterium]